MAVEEQLDGSWAHYPPLKNTSSDVPIPCPFCGHTEPNVADSQYQDIWIECDNCGAKGPHVDKRGVRTPTQAWNRRPITNKPLVPGGVSVDTTFDQVMEIMPYPRYSFPANNNDVERDRAVRYARSIARTIEALRVNAAPTCGGSL